MYPPLAALAALGAECLAADLAERPGFAEVVGELEDVMRLVLATTAAAGAGSAGSG